MVERIPDSPERRIDSKAENEKSPEIDPGLRKEAALDLESIRRRVDEEALTTDVANDKEEEQAHTIEQERGRQLNASADPGLVSKDIKKMAYKRVLKRTRKQLPPASRALSYIAHNTAVDELSEAAARTIARPSLLLGAGISGFLGSLIYYYALAGSGVYNFSMLAAFLGGGLILGWSAETGWKLLKRLS